jgi:hypothetical protein
VRCYPKAPGENMVRNADGTRRIPENGEYLRMQWAFIRRDYFPDIPASRDVNAACQKVLAWDADILADVEALNGVAGAEWRQSGRNWSWHAGYGRILPPTVLGP